MIRKSVRAQTGSTASWLLGIERIAHDVLPVAAAAIVSATFVSQASAQSFSQALVFGDSSVDSGFYKVLGSPGGSDKFNIAFTAAIAAGGSGAPTNSPGLMNSQVSSGLFRPEGRPGKPAGRHQLRNERRQEFHRQYWRPRGKWRVFGRNSHVKTGRQLSRLGGGPRECQRPLSS
jgi:hypothetical protein